MAFEQKHLGVALYAVLLPALVCFSQTAAAAQVWADKVVLPNKHNYPANQRSVPMVPIYLQDLRLRIWTSWGKDDLANKPVSCMFKLSRNGDLTDLKISKTSGSEAVDRAAIKIIKGVSPLHPRQREWPDCPKTIMVSFYKFQDLVVKEVP